MKRYYLVAMVMVVVMSISLIGYGVFINYEGESIISERMNNQTVMVNVAKAEYRNISPQYELTDAYMEAESLGDIIARVDGVISSSILYKNRQISVDEQIATLINEDLDLRLRQAESSLKKAKALELQSRNSYNRYSRLMELDATSREKMDEAQANYEAAVANVNDAQAQYEQAVLNRSRTNITSDVSGKVLVIYKDPGEYIQAGAPICMVGDFSLMWFAEYMDDNTIRALLGEAGEKAKFKLSMARPDLAKPYATEYYSGNRGKHAVLDTEINGIYPPLDQPADMRRVVFYVHNPGGVLESRSYEHLTLTADHSRRVLAVPYKALIYSNDQVYIMIVNAANELEKRAVRVGAEAGDYVEIQYGISPDDIVVVSGVDDLQEGQKVTANMEDR